MATSIASLLIAGSLVSAGLSAAAVAAGGQSAIVHTSAMTSPVEEARCADLARIALPDTTITAAAIQPAGQPVAGLTAQSLSGRDPSQGISGVPAFCRVQGRISPEAGSDVRFEVWLPAEGWNGRYMGVGNGGFAGSIRYREIADVLRTGYAVSSTDTGHAADRAEDASWAQGNPAKVRDFGYRAVHLTAINAKRLVAAYYRRPADKSYFQSCSNGGRQGLMEASRFPDDYDGILAGAPAAEFTRLAMAMIWTQQAQLSSGAALRPEQMPYLQKAVLEQCDRLDGQGDGIVDDPRMCRFDPAKVSCAASKAPQCLSPPQVDALRRIYAGPPASKGSPRIFAYPAMGAESGQPVPFLGWEKWIARGGQEPPQHAAFARGLLESLASPPLTSVDRFNWKTDPARFTAALGDVLDVKPDMTAFFGRGGKLIIYHGWADVAVPPEQTINLYENILRHSGPRASESARLFMIPGFQHCFGGGGVTEFGQNSAVPRDDRPENSVSVALQQWVERGRVPDSVIGLRSVAPLPPAPPAEQQRLLCPYPARAVLTPGADRDKAASYMCRRPPGA